MPGGKVPIKGGDNAIFNVATRTDLLLGEELQLFGVDPAGQADGHSVTLGTTTDTGWTGAGAASVIALLKDVALHLRGTLAASITGVVSIAGTVSTTVSGTVTTTVTGTVATTSTGSNAVGSQVDGHSATIGSTTDAAITTSAAGTLSAKLRGLIAILADVWDSTNHVLKVSGGAPAYVEDTTHPAASSGGLLMGVRQDPGYTPLASVTGRFSPLSVDDQGQLRVAPGQIVATVSTATRVPSSAGTVTMLASNTARIGATLQNDSSSVCYVHLGAGASSVNYTAKLAPNDPNGIGGLYESPFGYSGIITAAWQVPTGAIQVVELS